MYTWETARGKWVIERGGSGFRLKYYTNREELMLLNCGVGEDSWVPWIARRSSQSILKEISPEYSLEGLDAEAETPILWPPDVKNWLIWKDPDSGKD